MRSHAGSPPSRLPAGNDQGDGPERGGEDRRGESIQGSLLPVCRRSADETRRGTRNSRRSREERRGIPSPTPAPTATPTRPDGVSRNESPSRRPRPIRGGRPGRAGRAARRTARRTASARGRRRRDSRRRASARRRRRPREARRRRRQQERLDQHLVEVPVRREHDLDGGAGDESGEDDAPPRHLGIEPARAAAADAIATATRPGGCRRARADRPP